MLYHQPSRRRGRCGSWQAPGYLFIGEAKFEGEFNDYVQKGPTSLSINLFANMLSLAIFLEIMAQAYERQES